MSFPHRERSVLPLAFLCALALFVVSQYSLRWLPAYHDAALHWESAQLFFDRPWFPFVTEHDTGHPPLISWLLGALWHLPMSRLLAMHLLGWMAAALLCAAVFDIGRRTKGLFFGLCLATLVGFHPVVQAQALQLNLDLFQVAFAWTAVAGMVAGRPWQVALALTATSLTKLNGPFSIPPLALWIGWRLLQEGSLGNARRVLAAVWPIAIPSGVFVLYHALKYRLTGHLLVSPEFQDDNLRFVGSVSEYFERLRHALGQLLGFHNPNLWMLILTAILIVIFCVRLRVPGSVRTAWQPLQSWEVGASRATILSSPSAAGDAGTLGAVCERTPAAVGGATLLCPGSLHDGDPACAGSLSAADGGAGLSAAVATRTVGRDRSDAAALCPDFASAPRFLSAQGSC
jgi:hypothetical protein